jgi:hypothetical protein
MLQAFTRHPNAIGETYGGHLVQAWRFSLVLIGAGLACLLHGLVPFAFERTGSRCVERLHTAMQRRHAPQLQAAE